MQDFISFRTTPGQWGMASMMERIEYISERFGPKLNIPPGYWESFQSQLEKSAQAGETQQNEQFAGGLKEEHLLAQSAANSSQTASSATKGSADLEDIIMETANKYGLDDKLLRAIIKQESGFNPQAVSHKGAMGLMQLMPETAKELDVLNPFDPAENVDGGARYLKQMLDRFGGNKELALSAYNAGPKAVETYQGVPPYSETKNYVGSILNMLNSDG